MKSVAEIVAERDRYRKWVCELNIALHVLKEGDYKAIDINFAETVHNNYLKEIKDFLIHH